MTTPRYPVLRSLIVDLSVDNDGYDRTLPDDQCAWPHNADELERIAILLPEADRLAVAMGDGDQQERVLREHPEADALWSFLGEVFDGGLTDRFYAPYRTPAQRKARQ